MDNINFVELADFCVNRYKENHSGKTNVYDRTLYVSITEDNRVLCSYTPHILRNAYKCILVHQRSEKAVTNWYAWYTVEYIDEKGCVHGTKLENGFELYVTWLDKWSNMYMGLYYENNSLYTCYSPWEEHLPKIWELYTRVKDVKSKKEIFLISDIFNKDDTILKNEKEKEDLKFTEYLLKQERDQYKEMLDEIKKMLESRE